MNKLNLLSIAILTALGTFFVLSCGSSTSTSTASSGGSGGSTTSIYFYSVQSGSGTIDIATSGSDATLTNLSTYSTAHGMQAIAAHSTLKTVYAADATGKIYQLSATSAGLSNLAAPLTDAQLPLPVAMTISPNGQFLYVVDSSANSGVGRIRSYTINQSTGVLTQGSIPTVTDAGNPPNAPYNIAISPDGRFAYGAFFGSSSVCAFTVNSTTGALTQIGNTCTATTNSDFALAVSPNNNMLYVSGAGTGLQLFPINSTTGALGASSTVTLPGSAGSSSRAMVRNGNILYVAVNTGAIDAYAINSDGTLVAAIQNAVTGFTAGVDSIDALATSSSGDYVFGANNSSSVIYAFKSVSGTLTKASTDYTGNQASPNGAAVLSF